MSTRPDRPSLKENTGCRLPLTLPDRGAIGRMAPPLFRTIPEALASRPGSSSPHPTATAANSAAYSHFAQFLPRRRLTYRIVPSPCKPVMQPRHHTR